MVANKIRMSMKQLQVFLQFVHGYVVHDVDVQPYHYFDQNVHVKLSEKCRAP